MTPATHDEKLDAAIDGAYSLGYEHGEDAGYKRGKSARYWDGFMVGLVIALCASATLFIYAVTKDAGL